MKARYESQVVLWLTSAGSLALGLCFLFQAWQRHVYPDALDVREELWAMVWPWSLFSGFTDLRLLSVAATLTSCYLLSRLAGAVTGPASGVIAAGLFAASLGQRPASGDLCGGGALACTCLLLAEFLWTERKALALVVLALGLALIAPAWLPRPGIPRGELAWIDLCFVPLAGLLGLALVGWFAAGRGGPGRCLLPGCVLALASPFGLLWFEPVYALVACYAAVGIRGWNRACAGLTPRDLLLRFVLAFVVAIQLAALVPETSARVPNEIQRQNGARLARQLAAIDGEIQAPTRPWSLRHARKPPQARNPRALLLPWPAAHAGFTTVRAAFPEGQDMFTRAGSGPELLFWHLRADDRALLELLQTR